MPRTLGIFVLLGLAGAAAVADVVVTSSGRGKVTIQGLPDKIGDDEINENNWRIFVPQSTGVILEENYDSIVFKKTANLKEGKPIEIGTITDYMLSPLGRDASLDAGHGLLSAGNVAGALRSFQEVLKSDTARPVDKCEADFMIGFAYITSGRVKSAAAHFEKWNGGKSKYTPEAYRLLAEIQTAGKKYADARKSYGRISDLPDITEAWKFKARCGLVKVDIAERKFKEAEQAAAGIAKAAQSDPDSQALALGLQAQAVIAAQEEARYGEAEKLLRGALELKGVSTTQLAYLNLTLGDCLYSQRNIDEARYPYMRVVELYSDERGYAGEALVNAGNCFVDMSRQAREKAGDQKLADELIIKGMKLIMEAAGQRYGLASAKAAYKANKSEYEMAKKRVGDEDASDNSSEAGGSGGDKDDEENDK